MSMEKMLPHPDSFILATLEPIMSVCQRHFILICSPSAEAASFLKFVVAML